jgi:hypothetical protein
MTKKLLYYLLCIHYVSPNFSTLKQASYVVKHSINRGGTLASVKEHGLLSLKELLRRKIETDISLQSIIEAEKYVITNHFDTIYFTITEFPPVKTPVANYFHSIAKTMGAHKRKKVGLEVNPNTAYVYNRQFRYSHNQQKYNDSKISLTDYLHKLQGATCMQSTCPGNHVVLFDPYNATPFYVCNTDPRLGKVDDYKTGNQKQSLEESYHWYWAEVIVETPCITADKLIFFEQPSLFIRIGNMIWGQQK